MHNKIPKINLYIPNVYFNWANKNHIYHHLQKGDRKGNYNIILPGADILFGTYNTCIDNTEYCNKDDLSEYDKKLCKLQKENIVPISGIKYCK